jgi:hypothetical protein
MPKQKKDLKKPAFNREEAIEELLNRDINEIVNSILADERYTPGGDFRHLLYEGCKGYTNWIDDELQEEFN